MFALSVVELPWQTEVFPVMDSGVAGILFTMTASVLVVDVPQELLADTVIFPPLPPTVAEIELLVDVPIQPTGKVQT